MAIEAIKSAPYLGHGFGQEWTYLRDIGSEGRAHNAYMTVWIELGFGGLALLLAAIYQFVSRAVSLYRDSEFQMYGALLLAWSGRDLPGQLRLGDAVLGKAANDHPVDRDRPHRHLREESRVDGRTKRIRGAVRSPP